MASATSVALQALRRPVLFESHGLASLGLVAATVLALLAWLAPNHYQPWHSFHSDLAMAGAAVAAAAAVLWMNRSLKDRAPFLALAVLLAVPIPMLQSHFGLIYFLGDALMASLYLLGFALALIVGYNLVAARGLRLLLDHFSWLVVVGALLSVWLALYQWQQLDYLFVFAIGLPSGGRPFANFAQPNHLATLLVLGLSACAYLYETGRLGRGAAVALIAFFGLGVAMTQSRTGLLEISLIVVWLAARRRTMDRLNLRALAVASVVILGSVALWALVHRLSPELSVAARSADEAVSAGTRTTHWRSMLDAIGERPWFGYGWNQVVVAQSAVAHRHPATHEIIEHSHNVVLDLMVWNGIPLGLVLAGAMAWWSWLVARRARTAAAVLAIAPVLAVLVHGLLEFPLEYAYFLLPLGLLCGAITAEVMPSASFSLHKSLTPVLLVLAAGTTALVAGEYFRIEKDLQALRYELARVGLDKPRHQYSKVTWLTQLGGFLRFAQTPERQGMSEEELAWMGRVATRYPYWFGVVRYSAALALNDHPASAQQALSKICKTHPEAVCRNAQELWLALGKAQPKIRSVAWPAN